MGCSFSLDYSTILVQGGRYMDTKKIGKFIAEKRKEKGYTQEELGNILGVSNKTISRWENGNYMLTYLYLFH